MNYLNHTPIVLASKSPRRKELLSQAGIQFSIAVSHIDESAIPLVSPEDYVKKLALLKAENVGKTYPDTWIIGADTIVTIDNHILGKPKTKKDAATMLSRLNNRTHLVYTGFCLYHAQKSESLCQSVSTQVAFKRLTNKEIDWYINTNEPFDKAGAYGIQDMGAFLVKNITGSYTNVVGLPVCEVIQTLMDKQIIKM